MAKNQPIKLPPPDMNDPFRPPTPPIKVTCIHCEQKYRSSKMKWDGKQELWCCKNHPKCSGAGFGIDIFDSRQDGSEG